MKKILFTFLALIIISCSKETNEQVSALTDTVSQSQGKFIKTRIVTDMKTGSKTVRNFYFENTKLIKDEEVLQNGTIFKTEYSYIGNLLNEERTTISTKQDIESSKYNYDTQGRLSRVDNLKNGKFTGYDTYEYTSDGFLKKRNQFNSSGSLFQYDLYDYEITNGVVDKYTETEYSTGMTNYIYKFVFFVKKSITPYSKINLPKYLIHVGRNYNTIQKNTDFNSSFYEYKYKEDVPVEMIEKIDGIAVKKTEFLYY
ncbi:hypothetical protein JJC03_09395 [Flavobacterium oreochromis]|uniref:hypothetical protein n=1 Tax=Flavobacterium oreochromis TaxID=2906078 RepID=UPI001CE5F4A8|nr:hypothetical protein [Flavobacterium oreochromis]QYS85452.1 hypothetical protein JJC03_09395 [Flavobacterium oreochromis]